MKYFELIENPTGVTYERLIKTLCDYSDKFYFVTRQELDYDEMIVQQFTPYLLRKYRTKEWDATITDGPKATVYEIAINDRTYQLLQSLANSLYDWVSPNLPEDLTFIKNNFTWFYSCTHEEYATFSIRSKYYEQLMLGIDHLQVKRIQ